MRFSNSCLAAKLSGTRLTRAAGLHSSWKSSVTLRSVILLLAALLLLPRPTIAQHAQPIDPQVVEIASDGLRLKAFLWKPAGIGPFPAVVFNHGRSNTTQQYNRELTNAAAARVLGPVFARHGYVFLYPFRRGEGLSADQGAFIGDLLQREEFSKGINARRHLQLVLLTTDHLNDAMASLSFLKTLPDVDSHRLAVAGHSFGGQLALLAASRDSSIRAAVAFAPAAASWNESSELRERMLATVRKMTVPVLLLQAANDYSLSPTQVMGAELSRLSKPHERKIYPPAGKTANDGHNFLFSNVAQWEQDVFAFLDRYVR